MCLYTKKMLGMNLLENNKFIFFLFFYEINLVCNSMVRKKCASWDSSVDLTLVWRHKEESWNEK